MKMKILITGASGYLGSKIFKELKDSGLNVVGTYNNTKLFEDLVKADLTSQSEVAKLITDIKPQVIIHTAADAHTATCEKDPEYAQKINVETTRYLVEKANTNNIRFIHLSTFACFNENATAVYPKTKIQAEKIVEGLEDYVILRLSLVVGMSPNFESHNFYNDLIKAYKESSEFEADSSWQFEMSYIANVANVIKQILDKPEITKTMIPYFEEGVTSRYQIAKDLLGDKAVETTSNRIIPLPELDLSTFEKFGLARNSYQECIKAMKEELEDA